MSRVGCTYFIYGKNGVQGDKSQQCWWEKTKTETCLEGWESDSYNFYSLSTGQSEHIRSAGTYPRLYCGTRADIKKNEVLRHRLRARRLNQVHQVQRRPLQQQQGGSPVPHLWQRNIQRRRCKQVRPTSNPPMYAAARLNAVLIDHGPGVLTARKASTKAKTGRTNANWLSPVPACIAMVLF